MSLELKIAVLVCIFLVLLSSTIVYWLIPKKVKKKKCVANWRDLQDFCKDKTTWPEAIYSADKLLEKILKKRKIKGKSMGEKLVSAQDLFSDNDSVWYAHNYFKKLITGPTMKLKETEVKKALIGYRQALMDVGALPDVKSKSK